jgi:hypothetical protein
MVQQDTGNSGNQGGHRMDNRDPGNMWHDGCCGKKHPGSLRGLFWGFILIFLGVLFFASSQDWLSWHSWWQIFLIGLGVIFLVDALIQYLNTKHGAFGRVIAGLILITIGTAFLMHIESWWPLILIVIGLAIVFRFIFARR